jgi:predicted LPLAT superfamily acyltransferase
MCIAFIALSVVGVLGLTILEIVQMERDKRAQKKAMDDLADRIKRYCSHSPKGGEG